MRIWFGVTVWGYSLVVTCHPLRWWLGTAQRGWVSHELYLGPLTIAVST